MHVLSNWHLSLEVRKWLLIIHGKLEEIYETREVQRKKYFVLARGFDYMRLGGSHDRAEALKTGKQVQEAALLVKRKRSHGGSEGM